MTRLSNYADTVCIMPASKNKYKTMGDLSANEGSPLFMLWRIT